MAGDNSVTIWLDAARLGDDQAIRKLWDRYFRGWCASPRRGSPATSAATSTRRMWRSSAFHTFCDRVGRGQFPELAGRDELWRLLVVITSRKALAVARNRACQKRGGGRVVGESALLEDPEAGEKGLALFLGREPSPELAAQLAEDYRRLMDALGSHSLRTVAMMRLEGHNAGEIGRRLEISPRSVERKLQVIRAVWERIARAGPLKLSPIWSRRGGRMHWLRGAGMIEASVGTIPGSTRTSRLKEQAMDSISPLSRRGFVGLAASAAALAPLVGRTTHAQVQKTTETEPAADPWMGLKVGVASYTFSRLPLDATIKGISRVGVHYVSIKEAHLPLKSTAEQRKAVVAKFREAGITPLSCGNVSMRGGESELRNAFEYARDAGIPTIVCRRRWKTSRSWTAWSRSSISSWPSTTTVRRTRFSRRPWTSGRPSRSSMSGSGCASTWGIRPVPASIPPGRSGPVRRGSTTSTSRTSSAASLGPA